MLLNKEILGQYFNYYRNFKLSASFGQNESVDITLYKFGYLVTVYNDNVPVNQCYFDIWNDAISKFEELVETGLKSYIPEDKQEETKKFKQLEFAF